MLTTTLYGFILYYPYHISCAVIGWPEMAHITFIESYNGVPPPATGLCSCIHPPSSYGGRSARYWARAVILTYGPFLRRGNSLSTFYLSGHYYPYLLSCAYSIGGRKSVTYHSIAHIFLFLHFLYDSSFPSFFPLN